MSDPSNPYSTPFATPAASDQAAYDPEGNVLLLPPGKESNLRPSVIEAFKFPFQDENGMAVLLAASLCMLAQIVIPIVPQIVLFGYLAFLSESLIRRPERPALTFDFDHLSKYLGRGIWSFLAGLVAGLVGMIPLAIILLVFYVLLALGVAGIASQNEAAAVVAFIVGLVIFAGVSVIFSAVVQLFVGSIQFRAGMAGSFGAGFDFAWIKHFLTTVGMPLFKGLLLWFVLLFVLSALGALVLCVGAYVAQAWCFLALMHFLTQVYRLYLTRGGMPIAMKVETTLERLG